jgi:hypothetical protein
VVSDGVGQSDGGAYGEWLGTEKTRHATSWRKEIMGGAAPRAGGGTRLRLEGAILVPLRAAG